MTYDHTQRGYWHWGFYAIGALELTAPWFARDEEWWVTPLLLGVAALMFVLAMSCHHLRVFDAADHLAVRFGPLPLMGTRVRYDAITSAEPGHTIWLDGWGIHYVPWRGWTYNIWGRDCVVVGLGKKTIRIGTDDVDNLLAFLQTKLKPRVLEIG